MRNNLFFLNKIVGSTFLTGFSKYMPGTLSSLLVVPFYGMINNLTLNEFSVILTILISYTFYSVPIFEKKYGKDPSCYTIDEVLATFFLFFITSKYNFNPVIGFILWRLLDIFKPFYIKRLQKINGTWGVILDDIAAVGIAIILLYIIQII